MYTPEVEKKEFQIMPPNNIKVCFLKGFVEKTYKESISSFINNKEIWKESPNSLEHKSKYIYSQTSITYKGKAYSVYLLEIPINAIKTSKLRSVSKIAYSVASANTQLIFYQHGTFEAVYDFRKTLDF